jgi:hypothetical protein
MSDWKARLLEEKTELDKRRKLLYAFIDSDTFKTVDEAAQTRLFQQVAVMDKYSSILTERIGAMDESDGVVGDRTLEGKEG